MNDPLATSIGGTAAAEIGRALVAAGLRPRRLDLVSPFGERKGSGYAYRVDLDDGQVVKARRFTTEERATRNFALRAHLESAFAPAFGLDGRIVLEHWVEGRPLVGIEAEDHAANAGALLGRLHSLALPSGEPTSVETSLWVTSASADIDRLVAVNALSTDEGERLRSGLRRTDPGTAATVIAHLDFCAENMLIDPAGDLRVIDNELIAVRPAGLDLGRTFQRWPMTAEMRESFAAGYRSAAPRDPCAAEFWRIVASALGARVALERRPEVLGPALAALRAS